MKYAVNFGVKCISIVEIRFQRAEIFINSPSNVTSPQFTNTNLVP